MDYEATIRPALLRMLSDRPTYRVERDMHHHFSRSLGAAHFAAEYPTTAQYAWSARGFKRGNLDFYIFPGSQVPASGRATAVELNYGYLGAIKISQDLIKLLDPRNAYPETAYIAFSMRRGIRQAIEEGLRRAVSFFSELGSTLLGGSVHHVFAAELGSAAWEGRITTTAEIEWLDVAANVMPAPSPASLISSPALTGADSDTFITKAEAQQLLQRELEHAGIPLRSITARCMFEATRSTSGIRCRFGPTPLWDSCLRIVDGKVLRSEFGDWVQKLCSSGRKHQRAAAASWGKGR